ncbi:probable calcium-binding protein CML46 [Henckelia pumila]|uniref:probable calcium-binding protein CML46 n=1 Tax=Henckelia pumila TaxID=405737 RepID=UPI003C6E39E6
MSKCCRDLSRIFFVTDDTPLTSEPCFEWKIDTPTSVNIEDVEIVFQTLGLDCGARKGSNKRHKIARSQGSNIEVASVFDKVQPCLDEVREAFNIFDGNNDGFIDANELEKVIDSMGFTRFSGEEYQRMIMAFDYNDDGKIDIEEFVKLMKDSLLLLT